MRVFFTVLVGCTLMLFACNNKPKGSKINRGPVHSRLDSTGTQALMSVINNYYILKNALVAAKATDAAKGAAQLITATDSLQSILQKDSASYATLKPYIDTITAQSRAITNTQDESCERQRLFLGPLSNAVYVLLKNEQVENAGIYREYCPMAYNEKGAYWLSDVTEIENPYFGKKMLECGEVTDSLR